MFALTLYLLEGDDVETAAFEKQKLKQSVRLVELLAVKFGSAGYQNSKLIVPTQLKFSDFQVLQAVVMSRLLRDMQTVREAIHAVMVYHFGDVLQLPPTLTRPPSGTSLSRYVFAADMALVLHRSQESDSEPLVLFGWSDSSPLVGGDWCMNTCTALKKSRALAVWKSACLLDKAAGQLVSDMPASDKNELQATHATVLEELRTHVLLPANVDVGHVDAVHKAAAFCFAVALETSSRKHLTAVLQSYQSFTTDMGTELSISTLSSSLDDILPPWWRPQEAEAMRDGEVSDNDDGSTAQPLLQNCIPIPGILHVLHNLEHDLDKSLGHFADWYGTMKVFSALLCSAGRRRALYQSCIADTQYARLEIMSDHLSSAIPQPYEKRWGCINDFLVSTLSILQVLRQAWNENKYVVEAAADAQIKEFDPKAMTRGLKDGVS